MATIAHLVLADGSVFTGESIGAPVESFGEVVFNTSMTGYQEMLTDPSYGGQILVLTYPLIGNYGINDADFESRAVQVRGLVVREACALPSHWQSTRTLGEYLQQAGVPGLAGIDTRALTRRLRSRGVMMGLIATGSPDEALRRLRALPDYGSVDYVQQVSANEPYDWDAQEESGPRIALLDYGVKNNIMRSLTTLGARVRAFPCDTPADAILAANPDGILLSPGPGDPALLDYAIDHLKDLIGKRPMLGICLGHQLLGHALGAKTFKLPFGHRGGNHPVRDEATGRVYITSQNHGYAIDGDSLPPGLEASQVNLNDGTVEGLRHRDLPLITIQYHSEASPGPLDNMYVFERFMEMVRDRR
jgi:carbamoyl-phosphate synthase small subunit